MTTVSTPLTPPTSWPPTAMDAAARSDVDDRSPVPVVSEDGLLFFLLPSPKMPPPFFDTEPVLATGGAGEMATGWGGGGGPSGPVERRKSASDCRGQKSEMSRCRGQRCLCVGREDGPATRLCERADVVVV